MASAVVPTCVLVDGVDAGGELDRDARPVEHVVAVDLGHRVAASEIAQDVVTAPDGRKLRSLGGRLSWSVVRHRS